MGLNYWAVYCGGDILAVPTHPRWRRCSWRGSHHPHPDSFKFELEQAPAGAADLRLVI